MDRVLTTTFAILNTRLMSPGIIHLDFIVRFGPLALSTFDHRPQECPMSGLTTDHVALRLGLPTHICNLATWLLLVLFE